MIKIGLTDLRSNLKKCVSHVKSGERLIIMEHNKPIIEMNLINEDEKIPRWKKPRKRLYLKSKESAAKLYLKWKGEEMS